MGFALAPTFGAVGFCDFDVFVGPFSNSGLFFRVERFCDLAGHTEDE